MGVQNHSCTVLLKQLQPVHLTAGTILSVYFLYVGIGSVNALAVTVTAVVLSIECVTSFELLQHKLRLLSYNKSRGCRPCGDRSTIGAILMGILAKFAY